MNKKERIRMKVFFIFFIIYFNLFYLIKTIINYWSFLLYFCSYIIIFIKENYVTSLIKIIIFKISQNF